MATVMLHDKHGAVARSEDAAVGASVRAGEARVFG
jgi:hypothetical protein